MKRIIITGGSGKAGRHAVQYFLDHNYQVLNLDVRPLDNPAAATLITDIADAGQVFNALSPYVTDNPYTVSWSPGPIAGIVHFAAIPRMVLGPVLLVVEAVTALLLRDRWARVLLAGAMLMDIVPLSLFALHMTQAIRH